MNKIYELNDATLNEINNKKISYTIELETTKNLSYRMLKKIKNSKVTFIIKSALGQPKYYNYSEDKYRNRTIFSLTQTKKLIKQFEKLDKLVGNENDMVKKTLVIYKYLIGRIKYEDKHCFNKKGQDKRRTLYSLVIKKAVCSGFALILYEALCRNNIENYYIHSQNHLFNVVKINNKFYPLDVTWETSLKKKNKDDILHYFGNYPLFEETHKSVSGDEIFDYSYFESKDLYDKQINLKTHKCNRNNKTCFYIAQLPIGQNLKFYVIYDKFYGIFNIVSSIEDFDRIFNGKENYLIECYKSSLLKGERIKNKIKNNMSYVGYGEIENDIFYKHNKCENIVKINEKIEKNSIKFGYLGNFYTIFLKNNKFKLIME